MSRRDNLHNTCLQLEQTYVVWQRPATYQGCCVSRAWPAIGELRCGLIKDILLYFVTTKKRSIQVRDATGKVHGEVKLVTGMARELFKIASEAAHAYLAAEVAESTRITT